MTATPQAHNAYDLPPNVSKYIDVQTGENRWDDHWIWTGTYHPDGLPLIGSKMAHSTIYRYLNPEIANLDGRILRQCGEKKCVNPAHMRYPMREGPLKLSKLDPAVRKAWLSRPSGSSVTLAQLEGGVQKVQSVEIDTQNNLGLVKVLLRIAVALEEMNKK